MSLDLSLLSSRPVVSVKASKSSRTVPREARLARMVICKGFQGVWD